MAGEGFMEQAQREPKDLRLDQAHSARMYDFYLGGKTNYAPDRATAVKALSVWPDAMVAARENRAFMHRATRVLAREHGIRQWLDIGTGIPTSPNLHEVAQSVVPDARVVYADNDPIVLAHAQALMTSSEEGRTAYIEADARDPESILSAPELAETLDLDRPIAVSLNALLHFMPDDTDPYGVVRRLVDAVPSGSALAISHVTGDFDPVAISAIADVYRASGTPAAMRTRAEVAKFFAGLDLIEPGVSVAHRWRPESAEGMAVVGEDLTDANTSLWVGVAIKP
ncbi:SAM-dependent methyltransferase [Streptomyces meridianus]|uniref:SAM-dependent methyltransferase n=1 Tax=Streptomyces meridianus TaxID=2938945 RepID=A0ABT0X6L1_9ACTN|nr:SAM-dependent methyltransferase [Streptomyces meridianus]MCM2577578.1 SAM-dependent methyltransferase [Streptomyces meridianus]